MNFGKKQKKLSNPYLISYLSFALLCCVALTIIFLYINVQNVKRDQALQNRDKLLLITKDLEQQMDTFNNINLQISITKAYQPFYFKMNKYYEQTLLKDFPQYRSYSPLSDEYFLYYFGEESIFHSDGFTIRLDIYLENLKKEERQTLKQMLNQRENITRILPVHDCFYIFTPIWISNIEAAPTAMLVFVINNDTLNSRFQTVSGGLNGSLALYSGTKFLYTNQADAFSLNQKKILSGSTENEFFSVYFLPDYSNTSVFNIFPLHVLLILAVIIFCLSTGIIFAYHSYKPIQTIIRKYRQTLNLSEEAHFKNEMDEINYMMDSILQNNITANTQLEQKQEILRIQILQLLINGRYSFDVQPYLNQVKLFFPGPYFFVINISFNKQEEGPGRDFFVELKGLIEQLSEPREGKYVYGLLNPEQKHIYVMCSIMAPDKAYELTENVQDLAESFEYEPVIGRGNVYTDLSKLSASYLEALDNVHKSVLPHKDSGLEAQKTIYEQNELYRISGALSYGNKEAAGEALNGYIQNIENSNLSILMQQYIFTNFLSEITRVAREYHIELSHQSLSLIIAAKNIKNFKEAAESIIYDFCSKFLQQKNRIMEDESYRVFQYVNEHFSDYELSIEKVAEVLKTNTAFVRTAVREHTGKNYKDYLIFLRIDYAKDLLVKEKMTVAEVCQKVGYSNISYFIKAFKACTGVTPANWRRG